ncbi:MAG: hypothetical protein Q8R76_09405 [Candidatus Omnitrophota bacterium]|nr:hypothetical protein [Candidatus Omnitrophota bacterium]
MSCPSNFSRWQWGILLAGFFLSLLLPVVQIFHSSEISVLTHRSGAEWIRYPEAPHTLPRQVLTPTVFSKSISVEGFEDTAELELRAPGHVKLTVNGKTVWQRKWREGNWKKSGPIVVGRQLVPGRNLIVVEIDNPLGPHMFQLRSRAVTPPLQSDETWAVTQGNRPPARAVKVSEKSLPDAKTAYPTAAAALVRHGKLLGTLMAVFSLFFILGPQLRLKELIRWGPVCLLAGVTLIWGWLYVRVWTELPMRIGFDSGGHIGYVDFILEKGRLPLAHEGWSTFHPPLYYLLTSLCLGAVKIFSGTPAVISAAYRFIPFVCGLGHIFLCWALARCIFTDNSGKILLTVAAAAATPMNVYLSAYPGNEPLQSFLVGAAIVVTAHMLMRERALLGEALFIGALLGLAVLTKFTSLAAIPVIALFLGVKKTLIEKSPARDTLKYLTALIVPIVCITGWYFARNIAEYGRPVIVNWGLKDQLWWQDPGYHMPAYYLNFGAALVRPYFSAFLSFWDGMYSTFWGDGNLGGLAQLDEALQLGWWRFDLMTATYPLAVPATLMILLGFTACLRQGLGAGEIRRRWTLTFLATIAYTFIWFVAYATMRVPIFSQTKAFYCLSVMGPICVFFTLGFTATRDFLGARMGVLGKAILYGWLGTLLTVVYRTYGLG